MNVEQDPSSGAEPAEAITNKAALPGLQPSDGSSGIGRRGLLAVSAVAVLVVAVIAVAMSASEGDKDAQPAGDSSGSAPLNEARAQAAPEDRCFTLWNSSNDRVKRLYAYLPKSGDVYVSMGFAADFPDKCLITLGSLRTGQAAQFIEGGVSGLDNQSFGIIPGTPRRVAELPDSAMQWNARMIDDGEGSVEPDDQAQRERTRVTPTLTPASTTEAAPSTQSAGTTPEASNEEPAAGLISCPDVKDVGPTGNDPADARGFSVRGDTCDMATAVVRAFTRAQLTNPDPGQPISVRGYTCGDNFPRVECQGDAGRTIFFTLG
jgi:hypothetical protein